MAKSDFNEIYLSPAPHFSQPISTSKIMMFVVITLLPLCVSGVVYFGIPALITILLSVISCVGFETLFRVITKKDIRVKDCSAIITGLLLALTLPPSTPWWMTILGAFFAIVVAKEFFGGLGANVFNPALSGRAFLMMSFPAALSTWSSPFDAMSTATPLSILKNGDSVLALAEKMGLQNKAQVYIQLFIGNRAGSIGETCIMLIVLAFIILSVTKIIDWRAPVSMIVTSTVICSLAGMDPVISLISGGLLFGAVFMATDYATSPVTPMGRILFGIGCGLITALIRVFGGFPEGVMFSILIMNSVVPFLNKIIRKKYGFVPAKKGKA